MLVFWGSVVYFFGPMAFVYEKYTIFFLIINVLLIIMILGMVFICTLV
jgi:hypothetical protein